jgi:NTP pyrophosphatase (non-canonical NTP hydrolase)
MSTQITFEQMVQNLFKRPSGSWDANVNAGPMHAAIGLMGEASELMRGVADDNLANIIEELGDIRFYLQALLVDFGAVYESQVMCSAETDITGTVYVNPVSGSCAINFSVNLTYACGEVLDRIKKMWAYGRLDGFTEIRIALRDVMFWYQDVLNYYRLTDQQIKEGNVFKLVTGPKARYPNGFSNEAAIARADKAD